jgi:hypothetical protein
MHKDCAPQVWQAKPCQVWPQHRKKPGYGQVIWRGNLQYVHRIAYALSHGVMVEDLAYEDVVCHHCDNPPCLEPLHLFLGDRTINMADMEAKGRRRWGHTPNYGENHPMVKLTEEQVLEIRAIYDGALVKTGPRRDGRPLYKETALRYSVTPTLIGMIVRRACWKHI